MSRPMLTRLKAAILPRGLYPASANGWSQSDPMNEFGALCYDAGSAAGAVREARPPIAFLETKKATPWKILTR